MDISCFLTLFYAECYFLFFLECARLLFGWKDCKVSWIFTFLTQRFLLCRKKLYENYSELNLTQIIKSGEEAIKKISNISSIADAAEQVIEDAAQILKIIPERNNSEDSNYDYNYHHHVDAAIFWQVVIISFFSV